MSLMGVNRFQLPIIQAEHGCQYLAVSLTHWNINRRRNQVDEWQGETIPP